MPDSLYGKKGEPYPKKLSDGYRNEKCSRCNHTIGYGEWQAIRVDLVPHPVTGEEMWQYWLEHIPACPAD